MAKPKRQLTDFLTEDEQEENVLPGNEGKTMVGELMSVDLKHDADEKTVRKTLKLVNPELLKIFPLRDRTDDWDDPVMYKDLTDSMVEEGDQINPAVVRPTGEKDKPYELVIGWRRRKAAIFNNIRLLVEVRDLTDLECVELINEENEAREDRKPFETALYARKLWKSDLYKTQQELCAVLKIPQGTLSKRLAASEVSEHDFIYNILSPKTEILVNKSSKLSSPLQDEKVRGKVKKFCEEKLMQHPGKPNKVLDQVIAFIDSMSTKEPHSNLKPIDEAVKIDGVKAKVRRNRKGEIKIELPYLPENTDEFFAALSQRLAKIAK